MGTGAARSDATRLEESVRAARAGDRAALAHLVAVHTAPLAAFVRVRAGPLVCERESVEDLVQSVCREALADLSQIAYRGDREFRSWLFMLATRKILDRKRFYRRACRDVGRSVELAADGAPALPQAIESVATPSRIASSREEFARIEAAVAALPDAQRDAVLYVKILDLGYAEAALRLDRTESAVRGLVARALSELAARLSEARA